MRIYTIGYESISLNKYIETLSAFRVGVVLDVRENAWSYRSDFVKSSLQKSLAAAGIGYNHFRSAGNPSANRKTAKTVAECLCRYRKYLDANPECVNELYSFVRLAAEKDRPSCLTCYERNPEQCHRSILVEALSKLDPQIEPIHLPPKMLEGVPLLEQTLFDTALGIP